jgi:hypothetical protein
MKWALVFLAAMLASGCSKEVRRGTVVSVDVLSQDGKGYMVYGPVYSVTVKTESNEQFVFATEKKLQVGLDVCVAWSNMEQKASQTVCPEPEK